jgi:sodium transport system ATP-binding protein
VIEVAGVRKQFGRVVAVDDVSFSAPDGAITGLLGRNGAGKTTTLAMIAGVITPDAGRVAIDGVTRTGARSAEGLGALLDHRGLYARLTVRENVEYFARLSGLGPAAAQSSTAQTLARLNLSLLADRPAAGLSEGERVKVALARAVVHQPKNLILDEPTNGLDVAAVRALRDRLRAMRRDGLCIVFSSHVIDEVRQLCDRLVVIDAGRVIATGAPDEIRDRTGCASLEDAFVALTDAEEAGAC